MRKNAALALAVTAVLASAAAAMAQGMTTDHLAALDSNKDGAVDRSEFEAFMRTTFTTLDANGDGFLTVTETSAVIPAEAFPAADADGDGKLSSREFAATVTADFAKADLDGDGRLN